MSGQTSISFPCFFLEQPAFLAYRLTLSMGQKYYWVDSLHRPGSCDKILVCSLRDLHGPENSFGRKPICNSAYTES
jgi:hypothetical protein